MEFLSPSSDLEEDIEEKDHEDFQNTGINISLPTKGKYCQWSQEITEVVST